MLAKSGLSELRMFDDFIYSIIAISEDNIVILRFTNACLGVVTALQLVSLCWYISFSVLVMFYNITFLISISWVTHGRQDLVEIVCIDSATRLRQTVSDITQDSNNLESWWFFSTFHIFSYFTSSVMYEIIYVASNYTRSVESSDILFN